MAFHLFYFLGFLLFFTPLNADRKDRDYYYQPYSINYFFFSPWHDDFYPKANRNDPYPQNNGPIRLDVYQQSPYAESLKTFNNDQYFQENQRFIKKNLMNKHQQPYWKIDNN